MMQRTTAVIFSVKWETDVIQMGSVVVVADTHLGITKDSFSMPGYFADFLRYLKDEMEQKSVKIFDGTVKEKVLQEPEKVIFLGDIIELWDSEDEAVNFCLSSLVPILSEMRAEKIYILGNHDNTLERASLLRKDEYYVLGKSTLRLVENTYPSDGFLKIGKENYLFVHGHQFSPGLLFRLASAIDELFGTLLSKEIRVYDIIPSMRKLRNCIGSFFSYIFILFFLLSFVSWAIDRQMNMFVILIFLILGMPMLLIDHARRVYNRQVGLRYKKLETIDSFTKWWKEFVKGRELPTDINVVYGHTHFLSYISPNENESEEGSQLDFYLMKLKERHVEKNMPTLTNISAWIRDIGGRCREEYKNVMVASFLYIDEEGCEFFGWDWHAKKIFHIPKMAIIERRERGQVNEEMKAILEEVEWPKKLIEKWMTFFALDEDGPRDRLKRKLEKHLQVDPDFFLITLFFLILFSILPLAEPEFNWAIFLPLLLFLWMGFGVLTLFAGSGLLVQSAQKILAIWIPVLFISGLLDHVFRWKPGFWIFFVVTLTFFALLFAILFKKVLILAIKSIIAEKWYVMVIYIGFLWFFCVSIFSYFYWRFSCLSLVRCCVESNTATLDYYFYSMSTLTTLGTCDIVAEGSCKILVGIEALFGFVFISVIAGLIVSAVLEKTRRLSGV